MEKGKQKCEKLKSIRKAFTDANGVDFTPTECSSTDECRGTCPKCEAEAEYIMSKINEQNSATNIISVNAEDLSETISHEDKNGIIEDSVHENVLYADVDMGNIDIIDMEDLELIDSSSELMIDVDLPFDDFPEIDYLIDDNGDSPDIKDNHQNSIFNGCIYGIDDNIEDYKQNK